MAAKAAAPSAERIPIRVVASLTGVKPITLRAWERRYGLLRPARTPKGHRLYTHEQVELIRRVVALTERGVPIGQVRHALEAPAAPAPTDAWRERLERMASAIARFDEAELDHIQEEVLSLHPVSVVTRRLLMPLLAQLGARWGAIPGAIAEEHFFASYMRSKVGARLLHQGRRTEGPRIVAACAPGELHEIGLMLFCIAAAEAGLRCIVLGADTPAAEIAECRKRSGAAAIVISCSIDPAPGFLERDLPSLVREAGVPVFLGGAVSARRRTEVAAAGAIAVGSDTHDGAQLVLARLSKAPAKRP
jgi:DNA-binding transcriptional MerR regulator/methylmalonyl-CoA mutase cobalamin-binding subunit